MKESLKSSTVGTASFVAVVLCKLVMGIPASADQVTRDADSTEAFRVGYGMTFYGLGECGDRPLGELLRRAIMDRLDHCPFSAKAKAEFHVWAQETTAKMRGGLEQLLALHHGIYPERLDGMKQSCREMLNSDEHLRLHNLLMRYSRSEIPAEAIVTDACDVSAGGP